MLICQKIKSIMAMRFAHPDATNLATFLNLKELNSNFSKRKGRQYAKNQINHGDPICTPRGNQSRHFLNLKELNSNFSKRKGRQYAKNQINHGDPICTPRCNQSRQIFLFGELNRKFSKRKDLSICQKIKSIMAIRFAHPDATTLSTF